MKQTNPTYHDLLQKNQQLIQENQYLKEKLSMAALKEDIEPIENSFSSFYSASDQEQQKHNNEFQKSLILDATTESVSYYDTDLNIIWTNKVAAQLVGKSPHELSGKRCYEVWHKKNKPCTNCPVLKAKKLKIPQHAEQQTPDGRWWKISSYPVFNEEHRVIALAEFGYDITEQKQIERELKESEYRYRKLMEIAPVGIALFLNGNIYTANNKYLEILGYSSMDELKKNASFETVSGKKTGFPSDLNGTFSLYEKNGTKKYISRSNSEFNINGKRFVQVIIQDITEVISMEEKRKKLAGEIAYVERNLQILQKVEIELFKILNANNYKKEDFAIITKMIQKEVDLDKHWLIFRNNFESLHLSFFDKLTSLSPNLTQQDIKHCALIKMNYETKEIAALFNIQPSSVQMARVRLKKKLGLKPHQDLIHCIMTL